ncbi:hypothetical protein MPTK1_6g05930 [Marchantia polymorpha subsp. ruderalis]|uniref:Uncharacterized protein n=2 Tax=Marchantia polymorpha TaxID=3197 RepID=A0AAF6BP02_MARPO|nr:hypothetical protein MARPO_0097s0051 [Marchantia polymorpha]BBN13736.1 hypothetical protein Mp_6g05930 [Marchantia polymorpha subsp. ruderalis]|eukprot:PTQ32576.1 hypothetical protein MARPO_0097s0051 [Marchantia polymorpha]
MSKSFDVRTYLTEFSCQRCNGILRHPESPVTGCLKTRPVNLIEAGHVHTYLSSCPKAPTTKVCDSRKFMIR